MSRVAAIAIALIVGTAALIAQEPQAIAPVPPLPPPFDEWLAAWAPKRPRGESAPRSSNRPLPALSPSSRFSSAIGAGRVHAQSRVVSPTPVDAAARDRSADLHAVPAAPCEDRGSGRVSARGLSSRCGASNPTSADLQVCAPRFPRSRRSRYDPRRGPMFRSELFSALEILNRGDIELDRR